MNGISKKTQRGNVEVKALADAFEYIGVEKAKKLFWLKYERDHQLARTGVNSKRLI